MRMICMSNMDTVLNEKSIFIVELSEKFPGLNDYEKYYNRAKKYHEMGV